MTSLAFMRESSAQRVKELVKNDAPAAAAGYFFQRINKNNEVLRYPPTGNFKLDPFEAPTVVPNGYYSACYVRLLEDRRAMPVQNGRNCYPEIPYFFPASVSDATPDAAEEAAPETALAPRVQESERVRSLRAQLRAELERTPAVQEARADYVQRNLAMQLQEQQQDLLKYGHVVQELGGAFGLNRAYRTETQLGAETLMELAKRTAVDAHGLMTMFRQMQQMQSEALVEMRKQMAALASPPPPPPPPDYSGTASAALSLLRDLGVAYLQRGSGSGTGVPALPAAKGSDGLQAELQPKEGPPVALPGGPSPPAGAAQPLAAVATPPAGPPAGAQRAPASVNEVASPSASGTAPALLPDAPPAAPPFRESVPPAATHPAAAPPSAAAPSAVADESPEDGPTQEPSELAATLAAISEECQRIEALAQAGGQGSVQAPPRALSPEVLVPRSPLRVAPVRAVSVPPVLPVPPVMDPSRAAATLARAQRLFSSLGAVQEAAALLAIGDPARMEQVLSDIAAAVRP